MTFGRASWSEDKSDRVTYGKADTGLPPTACLHVWPEQSGREAAWWEHSILAFCMFTSSGDGIFLSAYPYWEGIIFFVTEATVWGINLNVWVSLCVCRGSAPFLTWRLESKLVPEHEEVKQAGRHVAPPVLPLLVNPWMTKGWGCEAVLIFYL